MGCTQNDEVLRYIMSKRKYTDEAFEAIKMIRRNNNVCKNCGAHMKSSSRFLFRKEFVTYHTCSGCKYLVEHGNEDIVMKKGSLRASPVS